MADKKTNEIDSTIISCPLEKIMHDSMMPYAEHVILDRALPRVEDGLKPVQRRILYSMLELGVTPDKPYRKSARVVGDCLGKYHPHGDTSVYGAMVRMAQPFNQNAILVDGHGNFGSIDGDPPAAMRYTEVRMMPLALELLRDLDKDTVKWALNFDDSCKEPTTLPGRYPNLLVNGAMGLAVGLSTNIPPHNLTEVIDGVCAYIDNPKISLEQMMDIIIAPDFPTGGIVLCGDELINAYRDGKGKVQIRSTVTVEKDGDKQSIIVTELPYQVNKAKLLTDIDRLSENQDSYLSNIQEVIDESDRNGMRVNIRLKKDTDPDEILELLYAKSDLQTNFNILMVVIAGARPQQLGLLEIIKYYVNYQREVILRRTQYDLSAAKAREHILEGIIIAIENIDEIIKIIKKSASTTDCKVTLRERYALSEKQAQAILDIKLARLTKLEVKKLQEEIEELKKLIEYLQSIVASKAKQLAVVKSELLGIRKEFKTPRKSAIGIAGEYQQIDIVDINYIEERSGIAILSGGDTLKFLSAKAYSSANKEYVNTETEICLQALKCDNQNPILAFTNLGNAVKIDVNDLGDDKWRSKGLPIRKVASGLAANEKIIYLANSEQLIKENVIVYTKFGMIKCSSGTDMLVDKKIYPIINLKDKDEVIAVEYKDDNKTVVMVSKSGLYLNMESDIPIMGRRTGGVIGMSLADKDYVIYAGQIDDDGEIMLISDKAHTKRIICSTLKITKRNRKGCKIYDLFGKNGNSIAFAQVVTEPYSVILTDSSGAISAVNTEFAPIDTVTTKGKLIDGIDGELKNAVKHNLI